MKHLQAILTILCLATAIAFGQPTVEDIPYWRTCDTCFKGFDINWADTLRFRFGVENIPHPRIAVTKYGATFMYDYGIPSSLAQYYDSTQWTPSGYEKRFDDSMYSVIYKQADSFGLKIMASPFDIFNLGFSTNGLEYYFRKSKVNTIQGYTHPDSSEPTPPNFAPLRSAMVLHEITRKFVSGVSLPYPADSGVMLVAGRERFTASGIRESDTIMYTHLRKYYGDNYRDSIHWFDLSVTMYIDVAEHLVQWNSLDSTDTLLYAISYHRLDTLQRGAGDCKCRWHVPFDTFAVRKSDYLAASNTAVKMGDKNDEKPYRTIRQLLNFERYRYKPAGKNDSATKAIVEYGDPLGWPSDSAQIYTPTNQTCYTRCDSLLTVLKNAGKVPATAFRLNDWVPENSDFFWDIYTTNKMPLTFLRSTIESHLLAIIERGDLDTLVKDNISSMYNDPTGSNALRRIIGRLSVFDEPKPQEYKFHRHISSVMQRAAQSLDANWLTGSLMSNPFGKPHEYRIFMGDYDSLALKMVGLLMEHAYTINGAIPAPFANPDSMDGGMNNDYYGHLICRNDTAGYQRYTASIQQKIYDKKEAARSMVQIGRYKYLNLAPPTQVYCNVQVGGWLDFNRDDGFNNRRWGGNSDRRPTTPNEQNAQAWLAMACGVDGLMFSDLGYTTTHLGIYNPTDTLAREYDSVRMHKPGTWPDKYKGPKIWWGQASKRAGLAALITDLKTIIPTYDQLDHKSLQVSVEKVNGTSVTFGTIPMLDTAYTIKAKKWSDSLGNYQPDGSDSLHNTYLEVAMFHPSPIGNLQGELAQGVTYWVIVNKRCWPNSLAVVAGDTGLGAIDVRKPVLRLNNGTRAISDSVTLAMVGPDSGWSTTVAWGAEVELPWLQPGDGCMIRVTPVHRGISDFGASFSNAVRSLKVHDRQFIVFERDSAIFLRAIDPQGIWGSKEWLISGTADTTNIAESGYQRAANNMYPAIAKSFDANSLMIVWERKDNEAGTSTIEACRLDTLPTTATLPGTTRRTLASPVTLTANWMRLMPSIVGLADSGYVVSWSRAPLKGINVVAVRNKNNFSLSNDVSSTQIAYAKASDPDVGFVVDTNAWHSTVAHVPKTGPRLYPGIAGGIKGGKKQDDVPWQYAHLAYQQGTPDQANSQFIFYNLVYARTVGTGKPVVNLALTEHVSKGLDGCGFLHPCIAADSTRIGVAFQLNTAKNRYVVLRFRDSIDTKGNVVGTDANGNPLRAWTTPAYKYGGEHWQPFINPPLTRPRIIPVYYERPSVTEFPSVSKSSLLARPEGGISWVWTNMKEIPGVNQNTGVMLYRYGWKRQEFQAWGHYPTMTLAPLATTTPFAFTSIFHRGDSIERFWQDHPYWDSARYYPGYIINTPTYESRQFLALPGQSRIHSYVTLVKPEEYCNGWLFGGGIGHDWIDGTPEHPPTPPGGMPTPPVGQPGLPPTFFATPSGTQFTTVEESERITRTGVFEASTQPVTIRRVVLRNDGLQAWLATAPFDSARNAPANVYLLTELVRASDSAVLWRGDTVTATSMDTVLQEEMVEVPVHVVTTPGTEVFVRLRTEVSQGLNYLVESGFHFAQSFDTASVMAKRRWYQEKDAEPETGERGIEAEVIPNPTMAGKVEVRLQARDAGTIRLGLYTMLGQQIATLPSVEIAQAGVVAHQVDLSSLQPGIYLLVAQQGKHKASAKVTVVGK